MKKIAYLLLALVCLALTSCDALLGMLGEGTAAVTTAPATDAPIVTTLPTVSEEKPPEGPHICSFVESVAEPQYLRSAATCTRPAEYYYSCSCGLAGSRSFYAGEPIAHVYSQSRAGEAFLKKAATVNSGALYYKSCVCGAIGEETFSHGKKLKAELYTPTTLTVTLYDAEHSVYGFTFHTVNEPKDPVIRVRVATEESFREYPATSAKATSYARDDSEIEYYVSKAEVPLRADTSYVYCVYDRSTEACTEEIPLATKDPSKETFTFVHVSDSQDGPDEFGRVLASVSDRADFVIHTGDVVEYSKYEEEWTEMLDGNAEYVASLPIMAISGNHETTYRNGSFETDKHFHNQLPEQSSTSLGYFYSFVYGDVRFIMLNTNDLTSKRLKPEQYDWLVGELANNTCRFTVVALHNPMYSVGKYGANPASNAISLALREQLGGIFAEYGVDLVLQGHDHVVSRTYPIDRLGVPQTETVVTENGVSYIVDPDGVIYVMNGPAGKQTRSPYEVDDTLYAYAATSKAASWAEIEVGEDTLTVTVKWHNGTSEQIYYSFGIKKS